MRKRSLYEVEHCGFVASGCSDPPRLRRRVHSNGDGLADTAVASVYHRRFAGAAARYVVAVLGAVGNRGYLPLVSRDVLLLCWLTPGLLGSAHHPAFGVREPAPDAVGVCERESGSEALTRHTALTTDSLRPVNEFTRAGTAVCQWEE
jgi:hypothetical protein